MLRELQLPQISPDVALGNKPEGMVAKSRLRRIGRTITDFGLQEKMPKHKKSEAVSYDGLKEATLAFTDYWRNNSFDLESGISGAAKLQDGTAIGFRGTAFNGQRDHGRGGRGVDWEFDVRTAAGNRLKISTGVVSYLKGEASNVEAIATHDFSKMTNLIFSDGETGHPISSYSFKERLEGYETTREVMELVKSAHQAGDVEILN